jgi:FkbM family methyltransferase
MTGTVHIACQADTKMLADLAVMLRSLLLANPGERFEIHFMHEATQPAAEIDALAQLATGLGAGWSPLVIEPDLLDGFPSVAHYGGRAACYRLLLPRLLPSLDRVLYLDADILVVDAVRPLWDLDLEGRAVGAVTNPLLPAMVDRVTTELGLSRAEDYFNSGVLVLDLGRLRAADLAADLERYARQPPVPIPWPDQDTLNAVLWRTRKDLHPRWNATTGMFRLPARLMPWSQADVAAARSDPALLHFEGPHKPRHQRFRHPYREQWFEHLAQTPWRTAPARPTTRDRLMRALPLLWQWRLARGVGRPAVLSTRRPIGRLARRLYRTAVPRRSGSALVDLVEALSRHTRAVRFVQVGSNDATNDDPLRPYVEAWGWSGVLVEPVPYVFERLRATYEHNPRLALENVAIGADDGPADFFHLAQSDDDLPHWYDQLGSFSREHIVKHGDDISDVGDRIVRTTVPSSTFESLCRRHGIERLDLVHIDAEGHDAVILRLIDLDKHRPAIVIYEHKHLDEPERAACHAYMSQHGYHWVEEGHDTVCVRRSAATRPWSRLGPTWARVRRR